jgi:hypothetical protein
MKTSKEILEKAGIIPKLRLGAKVGKKVIPTGPWRVRLLKDKEVIGRDAQTGKEIPMLRYLMDVLMKDGKTWEKRIYETKKYNKDTGDVSYLVIRLAEVPEGGEVILEMKKMGIKNFVDVREVGDPSTVEMEDHEVVTDEEVI